VSNVAADFLAKKGVRDSSLVILIKNPLDMTSGKLYPVPLQLIFYPFEQFFFVNFTLFLV